MHGENMSAKAACSRVLEPFHVRGLMPVATGRRLEFSLKSSNRIIVICVTAVVVTRRLVAAGKSGSLNLLTVLSKRG